MGPQGPHVVDYDQRDANQVRLHQEPVDQLSTSDRGTCYQNDAPKKAEYLLYPHCAGRLRSEVASQIKDINNHAARVLFHPDAQSGKEPRQRRHDGKTSKSSKWNHQRRPDEQQDIRWMSMAEIQVLPVMLRTIMLSAMMIDMRIIYEGRYQERYAAKHVPGHAERLVALRRQVNELVDEHHRAHVKNGC